MTLATTTPSVSYACSGLVEYAYNFKIFSDSDLQLTRTNASGVTSILTLTTDYTVSGAGDADGGTVTTVSTYSDGYLEIRRVIPLSQLTDFVNGDGFDADIVESAIDRLVMICQQISVNVEEGLQVTTWRGDWATTTSYSLGDLIIGDGGDNLYQCLVAHTAGTWATDLTAGKWRVALSISDIAAAINMPTLAIGSALKLVRQNVTGSAYEMVDPDDIIPVERLTIPTGARLTGDVYDFSIAQGTDADHDLDIGAGTCWSDDADPADRVKISLSAVTRQGDVALGSGSGGLSSSLTLSANTVYRIFALSSADGLTQTIGFDSDADATNLLSDHTAYTKKRKIGFWPTNASANWCDAIYKGNVMLFKSGSETQVATAINPTAWTKVTTTTVVPSEIVDEITVLPFNTADTEYIAIAPTNDFTTAPVYIRAVGAVATLWGNYGIGAEIPFVEAEDGVYVKEISSATTQNYAIHSVRIKL